MGCWRLRLCVQGGVAKAVSPVRRGGAWGTGEEVEGGGSEQFLHWGAVRPLLGTCKSDTKQVPQCGCALLGLVGMRCG